MSSVAANFVRLYVPRPLHSQLIGPGGSILKKIEADSKTRIRIPKQEDKSDVVSIQATADGSVSAAVAAITAIIGFAPSNQPLLCVQLDVPSNKIGSLLGKSGATLRELQQKSHCGVSVPKRDEVGGKVTASGTKADLQTLMTQITDLIGHIKIIGEPIFEEAKAFAKLDLTTPTDEVLFFPEAPNSDERLNRMIAFIKSATKSLDVAVYNMTDDRIARAIEEVHQQGVAVRIISHTSTMEDPGSDVHSLADIGVPVRIDVSPQLMHHKFGIVDKTFLINGSFNWTRSAAEGNAENVILTNNASLVKQFADHFEVMWADEVKLRTLTKH